MAKSARASKIKTNNSKLKSRVFGPIETARTERLSAKLLELASESKPAKKDTDEMLMDVEEGTEEDVTKGAASNAEKADDMQIDHSAANTSAKTKSGRGRIQKKRSSRAKASIVFPKYKSRSKR